MFVLQVVNILPPTCNASAALYTALVVDVIYSFLTASTASAATSDSNSFLRFADPLYTLLLVSLWRGSIPKVLTLVGHTSIIVWTENVTGFTLGLV